MHSPRHPRIDRNAAFSAFFSFASDEERRRAALGDGGAPWKAGLPQNAAIGTRVSSAAKHA
jgi:hypothetical protein